MYFMCFLRGRKCMYSKRLYRLSSTPCPPPPHTSLKYGQPPPPPTAMNAKASCGALPGKECDVLSVGSNAMTNAKTSSMQIVCKVSIFADVFGKMETHRQLLWPPHWDGSCQSLGKDSHSERSSLETTLQLQHGQRSQRGSGSTSVLHGMSIRSCKAIG